jgi:polyhydroxyalkanoate synthesis regulator phasin
MCCIICLEWAKGVMTTDEAKRNLGELIKPFEENNEENDHYYRVLERLLDLDQNEDDFT